MEHPMAEKETSTGGSPSLTMHAQYIKDLSFENPRASIIFTQQTGQPDVEVSVNVGANLKKMTDTKSHLTLTQKRK